MANYTDKVVKELAKENIEKIKEWRKDFIQRFDEHDIEMLQKFSNAIDELWRMHVRERQRFRQDTQPVFSIFGY